MIRPATAPASDNNTLSVSNWRTRSAREAPIAARMAISRVLAADLASSRLAMFAQAIRRTNPTAPSNTSNAGRSFAVATCWSERVSIVQPVSYDAG